LQVDYFLFSHIASSRNKFYQNYFSNQYILDYNSDYNSEKSFNNFIDLNYSNTFRQFVKGIITFFKNKSAVPILKSNGQYILPYNEAKEFEKIKSRKNYIPLSLQLDYFNKILEYAKTNNIEVFLVFPPVREYLLEYPSSDDKSLLDSLWQNSISSNVHFLDYSKDNRFLLGSYTDYVHLNSKGAELFSKILDNDIKKIFYEK